MDILALIRYLQKNNTIGIITSNDKMNKQNIVNELIKLEIDIDVKNIDISRDKNKYLERCAF
jgi:hypothetical protein